MPVAERKRMRGITTTLKSVRSNFLATLGKQLQEFVNISKIHDLTHPVTAGSERRAPQRISQSMLVDALFQPRCISEFFSNNSLSLLGVLPLFSSDTYMLLLFY